jgi:hypothetical protein
MAEISNPTPLKTGAKPKSARQMLKWTGFVLGALLLLILAYITFMLIRMNSMPADLDYDTTLASDQGLFSISYEPQPGQISVNQMHSWTLHVETPDGKPVENAQITVDGDMPQHGHGLPTRPQITKYLGSGDYQVDGIKFHMPGWWIVEFDIAAGDQSDHVTFNLRLQK